MSLLTATQVGQSFGALDLFSGITVSIPADGKIGLVGPNGVGKTTLLLMLAGITTPASGQIQMAKGTRLGYLTQESSQAFIGQKHTVYDELMTVFSALRADEARLRQMETAMTAGDVPDDLFEQYSRLQEQFELSGGYDYEIRIKQVLSGLGFMEEDWMLPLPHLSGGQKTRVLLARLLLEKPDLLILDEPTNHLDVAAIEWLEGALKTWEGAVLLVSHDRYFLDKVVNTVWEMSARGIETFRGNYSAYVRQRDERWERLELDFRTLRERLDKEMDYIRRNIAGQRTQMAQGKLSRLSREVEAIHAGGLGAVRMLKSAGWLQLTHTLNMKRPADGVAELQQRINELRGPSRPHVLKMQIEPAYRSGHIVLRTHDLVVGYPDKLLFTADDIELTRQERVALIGPNGTGKTTFLKTLLGHLNPLRGEIVPGASLDIGYFAQAHNKLNPDNTVLDEMIEATGMLISEARNYLARYLFRGDDVYKKTSSLSGGERGRLALSLLALQKANFLLLDEPTNHLDIPAQETLQSALETFSGTVLLVSHDRYLVDRLATQIWELRDGRLHVHNGSYQSYLAGRDREAEQAQAAASLMRAEQAMENNGSSRTGLSKNEQRKQDEALAALELEIHETEEKIARLILDLQDATQAQTFDKIQSLSVEYATIQTHLEELMGQWEMMHE